MDESFLRYLVEKYFPEYSIISSTRGKTGFYVKGEYYNYMFLTKQSIINRVCSKERDKRKVKLLLLKLNETSKNT